MATIDQVYEKVSRVAEDVSALKLHVLGNGGPGLAERLRQLENHAAERAPTILDVHKKVEGLEEFKNKVQGTLRTVAWCIPLVALSIAVVKFATGG